MAIKIENCPSCGKVPTVYEQAASYWQLAVRKWIVKCYCGAAWPGQTETEAVTGWNQIARVMEMAHEWEWED